MSGVIISICKRSRSHVFFLRASAGLLDSSPLSSSGRGTLKDSPLCCGNFCVSGARLESCSSSCLSHCNPLTLIMVLVAQTQSEKILFSLPSRLGWCVSLSWQFKTFNLLGYKFKEIILLMCVRFPGGWDRTRGSSGGILAQHRRCLVSTDVANSVKLYSFFSLTYVFLPSFLGRGLEEGKFPFLVKGDWSIMTVKSLKAYEFPESLPSSRCLR